MANGLSTRDVLEGLAVILNPNLSQGVITRRREDQARAQKEATRQADIQRELKSSGLRLAVTNIDKIPQDQRLPVLQEAAGFFGANSLLQLQSARTALSAQDKIRLTTAMKVASSNTTDKTNRARANEIINEITGGVGEQAVLGPEVAKPTAVTSSQELSRALNIIEKLENVSHTRNLTTNEQRALDQATRRATAFSQRNNPLADLELKSFARAPIPTLDANEEQRLLDLARNEVNSNGASIEDINGKPGMRTALRQQGVSDDKINAVFGPPGTSQRRTSGGVTIQNRPRLDLFDVGGS